MAQIKEDAWFKQDYTPVNTDDEDLKVMITSAPCMKRMITSVPCMNCHLMLKEIPNRLALSMPLNL